MPLKTDAPVASSTSPAPIEGGRFRVGAFAIVCAWLASLAWAATIYWFSSRTGPQIEEINIFELSDKVAHFIRIFRRVAPSLFALSGWSTRWSWSRIAFVTACILALYGAADEYHQTFTAESYRRRRMGWIGRFTRRTSRNARNCFPLCPN
jgi:hypothetical protein